MKKLIWQYNVKSSRKYDQGFQEIAACSIDTVARYAKKIGADHIVETEPTLFDEEKNFPGVDFFTFMKDSRYDEYDYLIKFDADFLIGPGFPDLSQSKDGYIGLAGYFMDEEKDKWRNHHELTWKNFDLDFEKWRRNYVMVGMAGFPRSTKRWLADTIDDEELKLLTQCKDTVMIHKDLNFKWSITEQSYVNYMLYHAPFKVKTVRYPPKSKKLVYHAGPRVPAQIVRWKRLHHYFVELWDQAEC